MKHRSRRICLATAIALLLLAAIPAYLYLHLRAGFTEQTAAERWQGGNEARFCQVSCFLDESVGLAPEQEYSLRQNLESGLAGESEERWVMALSGSAEVTVSYGSVSVSAKGLYTSGSYAHFHPIRFVSGSWFDPQEMNRDGVVLDMELAWKLFGGYELQGMSVYVNGVPVQVSGVARPPELRIEQEICGKAPMIWLSADLMERLGIEPRFTCVEAVLPDPVTHFAAQQLNTALGAGENTAEIVENTGRFRFLSCLKTFLDPRDRVVRTSRVSYPHWENAARVGESRCGLLAFALVLLLLFPALLCVYWLFHGLALLRRGLWSWLKKRKWRMMR